MDCPSDFTFDTEMSGERDTEESYHSKDEEDDTWIEITPAAEKIPNTKDLHTVNKHSKQSGTTASKQKNSESTLKVTKDSGESQKVKIVENNKTQKYRPCNNGKLYEHSKERI